MMFRPALLLAAACLAAAPMAGATARARGDVLSQRLGPGAQLRFRAANGGDFRPRALVVVAPGGAVAADLPGTALEARSEDHLDLSGVPVIGPLFRGTLDVATAREGPLVGPVYRVGETLVVEASNMPANLARRAVALTTNVPRLGAVSYLVGRLDWRPVAAPAVGTDPIGSAHFVRGGLVLASQGGEPAWPSVESMLRDLF